MRVADLAVFVVSAVEGLEVQAEVVWRRCAALGIPRMVFVNKLDRERADFERTLDQLREHLRRRHRPARAAHRRRGRSFRGVADLLTDAAFIYAADGTHTTEEVPDDLADLEHQVHDNLVEGIVVADDDLMERYLEGETPSVEELEHTLAHGVADCRRVPGGVRLGRHRRRRRPAGRLPVRDRPVARRPAAGHRRRPAAPSRGEARRRRASRWPSCSRPSPTPTSGQLSLFKVLSGTIKADDQLVNPTSGATERLHGLFLLRGKEQTPVTEVVAGDLAAVAKLAATRTGDTLAPKGTPVTVAPIEPPAAVLGIAVKPRTQADDDKLASSLQRLQAEDPALVVERNDETHQTVLRGMGETHLAVVLEKLARKFGVNVDTEDVRVPYRETIGGPAEAEGKYKKQTGGHGQFGVAWLRVEPRERGAGFEFVDKIVGGAIPRQFIPAVQKGIEETMSGGRRPRLPGGRRPGRVLRRQVPPGRFLRDELQDGGLDRLQGGDGQGRRRRAGAGVAACGSPCRPPTRAT